MCYLSSSIDSSCKATNSWRSYDSRHHLHRFFIHTHGRIFHRLRLLKLFVKVWESWWCLRCPWYEPTVSQFAVPQRREPPWRLWSSSQLSPPALRAPISRHSLSRSLYFSYSSFLSLLIFQPFSSCASFGRFYSFSIDRLPITSGVLCFFPGIQFLIMLFKIVRDQEVCVVALGGSCSLNSWGSRSRI